MSFLDAGIRLGYVNRLVSVLRFANGISKPYTSRQHPVNYFYAQAHCDGDRHCGDAQGANWD
jgi:hypothetical protein